MLNKELNLKKFSDLEHCASLKDFSFSRCISIHVFSRKIALQKNALQTPNRYYVVTCY